MPHHHIYYIHGRWCLCACMSHSIGSTRHIALTNECNICILSIFNYLTGCVKTRDYSLGKFTARFMWSRRLEMVRISADTAISRVLLPLYCVNKWFYIIIVVPRVYWWAYNHYFMNSIHYVIYLRSRRRTVRCHCNWPGSENRNATSHYVPVGPSICHVHLPSSMWKLPASRQSVNECS